MFRLQYGLASSALLIGTLAMTSLGCNDASRRETRTRDAGTRSHADDVTSSTDAALDAGPSPRDANAAPEPTDAGLATDAAVAEVVKDAAPSSEPPAENRAPAAAKPQEPKPNPDDPPAAPAPDDSPAQPPDSGTPPPKHETPADQGWPADCEKVYSFRSHNGTPGNPYVIPAGQEVHPQIGFETPWETDVQAVAFRFITDNRSILHHWNLWGQGEVFLLGWVPGAIASQAIPLTPDTGVYLPKDGVLRLDLHYFNVVSTTDAFDSSGFEVCVISDPAKFRKNTAAVSFLLGAATVPAHTSVNNVTTCTVTANQGDVTVLSVTPHMHLLGTHSKLELTHGDTRAAVDDAPFDFHNQRSKVLDPPLKLSHGDKLTITCGYKNDTDRTVLFGPDTDDEMCVYYFVSYPMGGFSCK